jgi:hypothetical protein
MQSPCLVNASALPSGTSIVFPQLGWRLATIARIEDRDRDGMLDRAKDREIGRLF